MRKFIQSMLRHKYILGIVLITGILAAFIWWRSPGSVLQETEIIIPVDLSRVPAGLTISGQEIKGIEVGVQGAPAALKALSNHKLKYAPEFYGLSEGTTSVVIDKALISLPKGLTILRVNPPSISFRVEKEINKQVRVNVSVSGKVASGYAVSASVSKPSSVILRGPTSALDPIDEVATKPVDVNGLSASIKKELALNLPEEVKVIFPSGVLLAEIDIQEKIITKKFETVPVTGKNSSFNYKISPRHITFEIQGPENILEKLHQENGLQASVDLKDLKPGVYVRHASISLPVKTTLTQVSPEVFTVTVLKQKHREIKKKKNSESRSQKSE